MATKENIEINDREAVEGAKKDPEKFAPLYNKYYKQIFLFIHKRTNNNDLTAELTSRVFYKALLHIKKYEDKGHPFSSWLYRISINEINGYFRNISNKRTVCLEPEGLINLKTEFIIPEFEKGKENRLIECLTKLKEKEIQLIELRYFEEKSFKEIGYILDISENNAKVSTYRVLEKLKKLFFPKDGE